MAKTKTAKINDDYLDLVKQFPLRPIRSEEEYDQASELLNELVASADDPGLSDGERDYVAVLTQLTQAYDEKHYPLPRGATPVGILKFLMDQHGMNSADLGKLLGSGRGQASLILNEKRELSKANIRTLAQHFNVEAGLFL